MRIGLTYDLREEYLALGYGEEETAEFDRQDTIDAIEQTLQNLGFETDRIGNAANLMMRLVSGDRWDMVFNIAEGLRGFGRESLVPALLEAHDIPYTFSDPMVLSLTLHKGPDVSICGWTPMVFRILWKSTLWRDYIPSIRICASLPKRPELTTGASLPPSFPHLSCGVHRK